MRPASVTRLPTGRDRDRRLAHAARAGGRALAAPSGRAWINGREVGGSDARYAHLARSHD